MLTFLEFYNSLLSFVNFKLYHNLGVSQSCIVYKAVQCGYSGRPLVAQA